MTLGDKTTAGVDNIFTTIDSGSVAISIPTISTACFSRPRRRTKLSEAKIAAAEPSEVGQHCSLAILPKCSGFEPYFSIYSLPALPNIWAAMGLLPISVNSDIKVINSSTTLEDKEPRSIFSKPKANTQSAFSDSTICFAKYKALEPVEQLLLTLYTGIATSIAKVAYTHERENDRKIGVDNLKPALHMLQAEMPILLQKTDGIIDKTLNLQRMKNHIRYGSNRELSTQKNYRVISLPLNTLKS
uniref:Uncharacterized protein n=1 Tax=Glossina brevipalpis TaxID=37001 RepID=A0A1A9WUT9_9MUSC